IRRVLVVTWGGLGEAADELAKIGLERFEKTGVALIGTIRRDGTPRISPCEVYVVDGELYLGMMWRSTKALDLLRDPRVLVHSTVCNRTGGYDEGEFKIRGRGVDLQDPAARDRYGDVVQAAID